MGRVVEFGQAPVSRAARTTTARVLADDSPWFVEIHQADSRSRYRAERFLEAEYARAFGGRIRQHYPMLMTAAGPDGDVLAAAGFRPATAEPLFLEQYLDDPIEVAIAWRLGEPVRRDDVVEIGNLASASPCASRVLFSALAYHLEQRGATHAVATATRQLRRSFRRICFPVSTLGAADAARLSQGGGDWGSYYARDPQIVVGHISSARPALRAGVVAAEALAARLAARTLSCAPFQAAK
ncbi:MAG: thermostable hemolysin [Phenylobacterium sp.]